MVKNLEPEDLFRNKTDNRSMDAMEYLDKLNDFQAFFSMHKEHYFESRGEGLPFFDDFNRNRWAPNYIIHYFTSIHFMRDYCRKEYPEESKSFIFVENCALAHFNKN